MQYLEIEIGNLVDYNIILSYRFSIIQFIDIVELDKVSVYLVDCAYHFNSRYNQQSSYNKIFVHLIDYQAKTINKYID